MRRRFHSLLLLATLTVITTQCEKVPSTTAAPSGSVVLASVAGEPITEADLLEEAGWRAANRQPVPPAPELLDEMIKRRALLAKARSEGFDEDPDTRRRMESILIARLRERDLERSVAGAKIREDELKEAYEARSKEIARKGMDRFAVLFLEASDKSSAERRAEVRARLEEGVAKSDASPAPGGRGPAAIGFGSIAADYSDDQIGRYRGGDIGWIEEGRSSARVPDVVLEAGRQLAKGERSSIIEAETGFYVIMKSDSRPGGMPAFDEVSPRLHQELLVEKRRAIEDRFLAAAIAEANVSIDSEALDKVTLSTSSKPSPSPELPTGPDAVPAPSASR